MNSFNLKKYNYSFFLLFLINITFISSNYTQFNVNLEDVNSEFGVLNIDFGSKIEEKCDKWIPSLFNPIILVNEHVAIGEEFSYLNNYQISNPLILFDELSVRIYNYTFMDNDNIKWARERFTSKIIYCYFGLLDRVGDYEKLNQTEVIINQLRERNTIDKKIFSFDKWNLNTPQISTIFYYGDSHEKFSEKTNGIIGSCKSEKVEKGWGCIFNEISFNNIIEDLKKDNGEPYNILFSTENIDIIIPNSFKGKFDNITSNKCIAEEYEKNITCKDFFNDDGYASLQLIDDNMKITIEIDSSYRFNKSNEEGRDKSRISYENINYFIFPLIMFKNFHVQFDAENNLISFFTTDKTILQLIKEKEEENNKKKGSSKGLTVFLVILIILIILVLGYGIFWFIRRRGSMENKINKYNKFEDEENFQNMNEKKVF